MITFAGFVIEDREQMAMIGKTINGEIGPGFVWEKRSEKDLIAVLRP